MDIKQGISLKPYSYMKIGGPAKFLIDVTSSEESVESIRWAKKKEERFHILGKGANTVFADEGFNGLVIHQNGGKIEFRDDEVVAESGVDMKDLITKTLENNLIGLEDFSAIPSTVGGAAFINLHYYKAFFGGFLVSATVYDLEKDDSYDVDNSWFEYAYDKSKLHDKKHILLKARLKLKMVEDWEKWKAVGRSEQITIDRGFKFPSEPSVGSIFQNLPSSAKETYGVPTLAAGYLIDKCDMKGTKVGGIEISHKHANIFINPKQEGTCKDLLSLIELVQGRVKEKFGINIEPEVRIVK